MDSLTSRLLSRSGLNRADPLVPPTHNMRMVVLKQEYGAAEQALDRARRALAVLERVQKDHPRDNVRIEAAAEALYREMEGLVGKEADFFASRYFGSGNKKVLKGWQVNWKQGMFGQKLVELYQRLVDRNNDITDNNLSAITQEAWRHANRAGTAMQMINQLWYPNGDRNPRRTTTPDFGNYPQVFGRSVSGIRTELNKALAGQNGSTHADVASIRESLRDAETFQRLAHLAMKNRWDLPHDLR